MAPAGLAAWVVRRRGWILAGWALAAAVLLPRACHVAEVLDVAAKVDASESQLVQRLLADSLHSPNARFAILVMAGIPGPASAEGMLLLQSAVRQLQDAPEVSGTVSWIDTQDSLFLAPDGVGTLVIAGLASSGDSAERLIPSLRQRTDHLARQLRRSHPGATLRWTGEVPLNVDLRRASSYDVRRAEARVVPLTGILLLLAFGAVAAAMLPVVCGATAISLALGAAAIVAIHWPMSILLQSVVSMLGLGLGIDYALLMVSRFREARAAGREPAAAAELAARHAGHTILLSAATVVVGFLVLLTVPLSEIRAIAAGGLLVVTISALLATTLLPGLLTWLGHRIDWGRVVRRPLAGAARARLDWRKLARLVTARPWRALLLGGAPVILLASQAGRLVIGLPRGDWLPPGMESAQGAADLRRMGRSGVIQGVRVVLRLPETTSVRRSAGWNALSRLADSLAADPRVARAHSIVALARAAGMGRSALSFLGDSVARGLVSDDARLAVVEVLPREGTTPEALVEFVRELRRDGDRYSGLAGADVLVGGLPAFNADYSDAAAGRFGAVVLLVVGGTLLALFLGTRSVLVSLKAVLLNLLSVAAAFGALTLVFQLGAGASLFGLTEPLGAVFSTLPVIVFCVVFGLSMDYELFLVTRIMEARRAGMGNRDAIIEALGATGPVITSAAAVMVVVFAGFTLGELLFIKMLGFALAVAVILDATLVRMVIGPALLQLAGRWNWWPGERGTGRNA